jgi:transposase
VLRVDSESDIEVLRQATKLLVSENDRLMKKVVELTKQLLVAQGKDKRDLQLQLLDLQRQLDAANKKIFGDSSEKRPGDEANDEPVPEKPKQKGHGPKAQPKLPIVPVVHELDVADQTCTQCGSPLAEWEGQVETSEEIHVVRRRFELHTHIQKKYVCQCGGCVETALGPEKLFPGARYSITVAVDIAVLKYVDHLPLERIARIWGREGLDITSQTLWDYLERGARLLTPTYQRLHEHILGMPLVGADETTWRLMAHKGHKGESKTWWVWALATPRAVFYLLKSSRGLASAKAILHGYAGTVLCDGYGVYASLAAECPAISLAHCWAHVRREYLEIEKAFPEETKQILDLIGMLYATERAAPRGPPGDTLRAQGRAAQSTEVLARIFGWVVETYPLQTPENGLACAIRYMANVWPGLVRFLEEPRLAIDNNATERAIRGVVIGRKNHYGSRSERGTEVAALFYSLVESAKLAGLDPAMYLESAIRAALRGERPLLPHEMADAAAVPPTADG